MTDTNTTSEYWSIGSTSLQTLRWTIEDFGPLEAPPPFRGDTITVPYKTGQIWRERVVDSRTLTFNMVVYNCDDAGLNPSQTQLMQNWVLLRALFWGAAGSQLTITKRSGAGIMSVGALTATGYGVFAGGLEPVNLGMQGLRFSADIFMADPYFYDGATAYL